MRYQAHKEECQALKASIQNLQSERHLTLHCLRNSCRIVYAFFEHRSQLGNYSFDDNNLSHSVHESLESLEQLQD